MLVLACRYTEQISTHSVNYCQEMAFLSIQRYFIQLSDENRSANRPSNCMITPKKLSEVQENRNKNRPRNGENLQRNPQRIDSEKPGRNRPQRYGTSLAVFAPRSVFFSGRKRPSDFWKKQEPLCLALGGFACGVQSRVTWYACIGS